MTRRANATAPSRPPNIVLVHWHDLGTRLNAYGCHDVRSPCVDALAGQGLRFDSAFSTAPLCSPARGSLFTGRYPARHGLTGLAHLGARYATDVRTLPALLRDAGYSSALVGLQHEAVDPRSLGFDEVIQPDEEPYHCGPVTDLAVSWLRGRPKAAGPYFLSIGFIETHRPFTSDGYEPEDDSDVLVPAYLPNNPDTRADLAMMARAIEEADAATGRIIEAVKGSADADDTMVVFTTDHGPPFPRAKCTLYDPGIRVALVIRPPRSWQIPPGVVTDLVSHVDVAPTLLELAGTAAAGTDGLSFAQVVRGRPGKPREEIYAAKDFHDAYDPVRCVRTLRYKYIRSYAPGPKLLLPGDIERSRTRKGLGDEHLAPRPPEELYDLRDDPAELVDLAPDPSRQDVLDTMRGRMDAWLASIADPIRNKDLWGART